MCDNKLESNTSLDNIHELIWKGEIIEDTCHMEELRRAFLDNLCRSETSEKGMEEQIISCKNSLERIQIIRNFFQWSPPPVHLFQRLQKNKEFSCIFRERANVSYKQQDLRTALRGYNLAIAFGRTKEPELGLAFANRAAILLQIKEPHQALRDIGLARLNCFPSNLLGKLEERAAKCHQMIENMAHSKSNQTSSESQNLSKQHQQNYSDQEFFSVKNPSQRIVGSEDFIRISNNEGRGRGIVVDKDVLAGSLILVEKPYVAVLERELKWDTHHCQFCLKSILGGIPCLQCTFAMYCDEECRLAAEHFHQHEHKIWMYLHAISSSQRDLLAVRIIETVGYAKMAELFLQPGKRDSEALMTEQGSCVPGFGSNGIYDVSNYEPVYHLVSHPNQQELRDSVSNAFKAIMLTHLLEEQSEYFEQLKKTINSAPEQRQQLFDFTASLILHHLENIPYNAISLNEFRWDNMENCHLPNLSKSAMDGSLRSVSYASAIFGLLSMCNHSCSPNAVHVRSSVRKETALITLRSLRAGEEVCITYGPLFQVHDFKKRQEILKEKYNFDCTCDACSKRWEIDTNSALAIDSSIDLELFDKTLLQVHELIKDGNYVKAMQLLRPTLNSITSTFPQTFPLTQVAQDLFKKALIFIVNC